MKIVTIKEQSELEIGNLVLIPFINEKFKIKTKQELQWCKDIKAQKVEIFLISNLEIKENDYAIKLGIANEDKENRLFHIKDQNLEGINRSSFWKKVMATSNKKYKEIPQLTDLSIQQMLDNQDVEDFAIQYFIGENGDTIEIDNKN